VESPAITAPTVTVLVMTYNHERLIAQALDSALMQEAAFPYEILISEDLSTDGTRDIVVGYQRRHPDRIRLLLSERNLHSNEVVRRGLRAARGKYVALLDGDDYWTSPLKLQRQVDFLAAHPQCTVCFHNVLLLDESGAPPRPYTRARQSEISTLEDLWKGNFIATCSTMYRNGVIGDVPEWYVPMFPITDWPLHILHAEHGTVGYIDEVMGVYRYHSGGLYSVLSERRKLETTAAFYETMDANLDGRHTAAITRGMFQYFSEWAEEYVRRGDVDGARTCLRRCFARRPAGLASLARLGRLWLKLYRRRFASRAADRESPHVEHA
jgi:glycosyltransferase involved in cell wall biosynthesis